MLLREIYLALPLWSLHCLEAHIAYFTWNHYFISYTSWISTLTGAKTMADPLRSATSGAIIDDTSLAVPTDNKLRTGQQRVLDQVHTIKRSKSKHGKSGTLSPTSPVSSQNSVFSEFGSFKFSPASTTTNGLLNRSSTIQVKSGGGYSKSVKAQKTRSLSTKSRYVSTSGQLEKQFTPSAFPQPPNGLKLSRSDPALDPPVAAVPGSQMRATGQTLQGSRQFRSQSNRHSLHSVHTSNQQMTSSGTRLGRLSSLHSGSGSRVSLTKAGKTEQEQSMQNEEISMANLTLKEAVEFLSTPEESNQQCGASFIQHCTFSEESPKQEVLTLGGIPPLVALLRSPNPDVCQSASGALRNLVFKDQDNKQEVKKHGGIGNALELLKETNSTETQKQITGLLWNMSSEDGMKKELIDSALPVLTDSVLVPFTCWSDTSVNNNIHPDVFFSATGCLRNLSCAKEKQRQTMRECDGLIDALLSYIQSCVAEDNPDDKSVENCACILHNLTYQLETESPGCFSKFSPPPSPGAPGATDSSTVGCFSPKSSKLKEIQFDMNKSMKDDSLPSGVDWLCHPKAMVAYLSLLGTSQKDSTQEASIGALQNLTAKKGPASNAISQVLVQKLGAMPTVSPLLRSDNKTLQKTAMCLMGNMSRSTSIQSSIAKQVLPDLASLLSSGTSGMGNNDDTIATSCNNFRSLLTADNNVSKKLLSSELVTSLANLSENTSFPKGSKAASLLLYSLWNEKSLQGALKKLSLGKSLFINDVTAAARKSAQVVE
ncbi:unnamed protein product [Gadus morhua 'NCC']